MDLDIACAALMAEWFGLRRRIERSSALNICGDRSQRLVISAAVSAHASERQRRAEATSMSRCSSATASASTGSSMHTRSARSVTTDSFLTCRHSICCSTAVTEHH